MDDVTQGVAQTVDAPVTAAPVDPKIAFEALPVDKQISEIYDAIATLKAAQPVAADPAEYVATVLSVKRLLAHIFGE